MLLLRSELRLSLDSETMVRLHMLPGGYHAVSPTPKGEGAGEAFFIGGNMERRLCACGCGGTTAASTRTDKKFGLIKGVPNKFINHHQNKGPNNYRWIGGRKVSPDGYQMVLMRGHPSASSNGYIYEHILIAETALGHCLPHGAIVHHVDEKQGSINPRALVICPGAAYHKLLHRRSKALAICGNADWRKCSICKQYDSPDNLYIKPPPNEHCVHRQCSALQRRNLLLLSRAKERDKS